MDSRFARRQLEKFGWTDGQGLGKNEDGIARPVKVGIKRDNGGVGLSPSDGFANHWWSTIFNKAASNIAVSNGEDGVVIKAKGSEAARSLTRRHYGRHRHSLLYGGFVHCSSSASGNHGNERGQGCLAPISTDGETKSVRVSDEVLWRACGGRTAHKAARHGLRLSGKLKRVGNQEQQQEQQRLCKGQCAVSSSSLTSPQLRKCSDHQPLPGKGTRTSIVQTTGKKRRRRNGCRDEPVEPDNQCDGREVDRKDGLIRKIKKTSQSVGKDFGSNRTSV